MNADELLARLALNYGNPSGNKAARAALLVKISGKAETWRVECKATDPGGPPPAAKILTTLAKRLGPAEFLNDYCLALNYTPTDWCLGLAWLLRVKYVLYPGQGGTKGLQTSTDDATNTGFPERALSTWDWKCAFDLKTRAFTYEVDSYKRPTTNQLGEKTSIQAIINSVGTAELIAAISFAGVTFSRVPAPNDGFIPMPGNAFRDDAFVRTAFALVNQTWKHGGGRQDGLAGHNIGAVAVGQDDRILGWAVNVSEVSRCFHAESLLVVKLLGSGIDLKNIKLRIYATLEPCQMCSGLITTMCPGAKVIYGMPDAKIKNSSLARKRNGCEQVLCTTIVNFDETIPSMLARLKDAGRFDNTTGFLDAPRAARGAFQGAKTSLDKTPGTIRVAQGKADTTLAQINQLPKDRQRALAALLDVRPETRPFASTKNKFDGLDLAVPAVQRTPPQLVWGGPTMRAHLPFVQYLHDFLGTAVMNQG